jgi:hypothetical protein
MLVNYLNLLIFTYSMKKSKSVTVSLPAEQIERVKRFSKDTGRTLSGLISYSLDRIMEGKK